MGKFGPAIRRCSPSRRNCAVIAPDRLAAEQARRLGPAALRTAGGQSMTNGTTIATAFAAARFSRVPASSGLRHDGHGAAGGACGKAGEGPTTATMKRPKRGGPGRAGEPASDLRPVVADHRANGHRGGRDVARDCRSWRETAGGAPLRIGSQAGGGVAHEALPHWPADWLHGPVPAGQRLAPSRSPVGSVECAREHRPAKAAKRAKRGALKRRRRRDFAQARFLTPAGLTPPSRSAANCPHPRPLSRSGRGEQEARCSRRYWQTLAAVSNEIPRSPRRKRLRIGWATPDSLATRYSVSPQLRMAWRSSSTRFRPRDARCTRRFDVAIGCGLPWLECCVG